MRRARRWCRGNDCEELWEWASKLLLVSTPAAAAAVVAFAPAIAAPIV